MVAGEDDIAIPANRLRQQVMQYVGLPDVGYCDRVEPIVVQGETIDLPADLAKAHQTDA